MSSPDAVAPHQTFDVERLFGRRADRRWERTAIGDVFERLTWSAPDRTVLVGTGAAVADPAYARVTAREADDAANRVAQALLAEGLQRGDRVALFSENSVEAVLTKVGIAKAGGVAVPLNVGLAADVVEYLLRHVDAGLAVVDAELAGRCAPAFGAAGTRVLAHIGARHTDQALAWADWTAGHPAREPDVAIAGDDIWEILHTSGTTAMPKSAMVTHHAVHYAALSFALSISRGLVLESELRTCTALPVIYHVGDHVWPLSPLMTGGSAVLGRGADHPALAQAITTERATALWGGSPALITDFVRAV
ncbi:MAG: AMP-binding protein [Solirubrobacterales bacterium]|nr:AMP-binding protein [Solirubrobacterales bacterium]